MDLEQLNALFDRQLEPDRHAAILAGAIRDPELHAILTSYKRQTERLKALYDPLLDEPIPPSLLAVVRG